MAKAPKSKTTSQDGAKGGMATMPPKDQAKGPAATKKMKGKKPC
jgi:hypothetical protein